MTDMQITLNQIEIETAIRNFVNEQVNIREGQDITIDLKAGRGPEGFTATIDIVPMAKSQPAPTSTATPAKAVAKATVVPAEANPAPTETQASDEQGETPAAAQETSAEAEGGDEQEGKRPNLFANLNKPRNS